MSFSFSLYKRPFHGPDNSIHLSGVDGCVVDHKAAAFLRFFPCGIVIPQKAHPQSFLFKAERKFPVAKLGFHLQQEMKARIRFQNGDLILQPRSRNGAAEGFAKTAVIFFGSVQMLFKMPLRNKCCQSALLQNRNRAGIKESFWANRSINSRGRII